MDEKGERCEEGGARRAIKSVGGERKEVHMHQFGGIHRPYSHVAAHCISLKEAPFEKERNNSDNAEPRLSEWTRVLGVRCGEQTHRQGTQTEGMQAAGVQVRHAGKPANNTVTPGALAQTRPRLACSCPASPRCPPPASPSRTNLQRGG
jgi:hypothetical protein